MSHTHTRTPPQMFCVHASQSQQGFELSSRLFFFYLRFIIHYHDTKHASTNICTLLNYFCTVCSLLITQFDVLAKQSLLRSWSRHSMWLPLREPWPCCPARWKAPCATTWPGTERVVPSEPAQGGWRCCPTRPCRSAGCGLRMLGSTTVWPPMPMETAESPCGFSFQVR